MEKTRQENAIENNLLETTPEQDKDLRTLKDLELMMVGGGGDDNPSW